MENLFLVIYYAFMTLFSVGILMGIFILMVTMVSESARKKVHEIFKEDSSIGIFPNITTIFFLMYSHYYEYLSSVKINSLLLLIMILSATVGVINLLFSVRNKALSSLISLAMYWWIYAHYF